MNRRVRADIAYISDGKNFLLKGMGTVRGYRLFDDNGNAIIDMQ